MKKKLFRIAALPGSLSVLLKGQLAFINSEFEVVGLASPGAPHQTLRQQEGIRTIEVKINRRIRPFEDLASLARLYWVFKKEKPFIIHSITPKAGLLSMLAGWLAGVPIRMHTFTGLVFPTQKGLMKKMLIFIDKVICFCATHVYPEGQGVKRDLIDYGITNKPLKIIGHGNVNGIDLDHFNPELYTKDDIDGLKSDLGLAPNDFVWLFVGRITNDKGITELITAFKEIQEQNPSSKLVLVGPYERELDPLPAEIESEMHNNPAILSVGWQKDVRPYFALCNVFVFPSYREGFPNVLLQAGAMGKYCIVTDINGSNEIIENDINGTIIPPKDASQLIDAMRKTLTKIEVSTSANNLYRKRIADRYSNTFVWTEQLEEYRRLSHLYSDK
ncbi:glycosyltransferase family 4 protein [Pseudozobellia thermophila]|uniref:Glycosyltransferase involved in cell wall bisynthesis n=1 Tax=Pseudozobellia thermophila TaxID=192903 RepID=A0A1M6IWK7_9FLAO|nr:glycosyltransferase family 4 protein [Pseudozobellia thermophila]SHJ38759.1 Glycosyltransferase involved in cell wall bisynthesis [Pseudozobellia thermophila]